MLLLLPPSETKRDGGNAASGEELPPGALRFPGLASLRDGVRRDLVRLSRDAREARAALKLSERLAERELARNRGLGEADVPLMPAALRYTGVLYDALDAASLGPEAWSWLISHVAIQSALYGLAGAGEPIAAYRLSAGSRVPGESLRRRWAEPCARALASHGGLVVDLRSKAYAEMGPLPVGAVTVEVVAAGPGGEERALGHFNKAAKGSFTRTLAQAAPFAEPGSVTELAELACSLGLRARADGDGSLVLVADDPRQ